MQTNDYKYKPTTALTKIAQMSKPIRSVTGGQGSGKTISILMLLINHCIHTPNATVTVAQYEKTKLRKTILRDFLAMMKDYGYYTEDRWNRTELTFYFPNGSYIEFIGLDSTDIGKGMRRNIIYINEVNRGLITLETFTQLQSRCDIIYVDYNPDSRTWLHLEVLVYPNAEEIVLTYKDNEYIPKGELRAILDYAEKGLYDPYGSVDDTDNIKNKYWWNKWRVYGLGLVGTTEGTVITDWEIIEGIPKEARVLGTGLDFGFNDPTASADVYLWNQSLVVDERLFDTHLSMEAIADALRSTPGTTYADSAEPRSIRNLRRLGVKILPAKKESGSVVAGIKLLQERTIYVTKRSAKIIEAFTNYKFIQNTDGSWSNKPHHDFSDIVDAIRYCVYMKLKPTRPTEGRRYAIV